MPQIICVLYIDQYFKMSGLQLLVFPSQHVTDDVIYLGNQISESKQPTSKNTKDAQIKSSPSSVQLYLAV